MINDVGWVNVGISSDTAASAVESIPRWWQRLGKARYPGARKLLNTADCGGFNGIRVRLWKLELQKLARKLGIEISVRHLPPGTSKWNRVEHRLLSLGLARKGLHPSMFRFRGTTLCIGEDADSMDSLLLVTGVGDWRSWTARGVCRCRQGRHASQLAISRKPAAWLFSGWNWVPIIVSRATIAVISPP